VATDTEEGGGLGFGERGGGREGTPLDTREGEGWWSELLHGPMMCCSVSDQFAVCAERALNKLNFL
jgi:hypothetical protein